MAESMFESDMSAQSSGVDESVLSDLSSTHMATYRPVVRRNGPAGPWYRSLAFWAAATCIAMMILYVVYAHSMDQRVREYHRQKYALKGRQRHLRSLRESLAKGHRVNDSEADVLREPDDVKYA